MCGRFTLTKNAREVEEYIRESFFIEDEIPISLPRYNIAPSQSVLAIIRVNESFKTIAFTWGFIQSFVGSNKKLELINVRTESINEKWFLKEALEKRRCLIVADGFFEWEQTDLGKVPYWIHRKNKELLFFAGVFSIEKNQKENQYTAAILTKEASVLMNHIHQRMPVMLAAKEGIDYLRSGFVGSLQPIMDNVLSLYPVSKIVNNTINDREECIEKVELIRLEL